MTRSFLRMRDVMKLTGKSRSAVYRSIERDEFPAPIHLSRKMSVWVSDEVEDWIERTIAKARAAERLIAEGRPTPRARLKSEAPAVTE
jgi:prophage regulatory protein